MKIAMAMGNKFDITDKNFKFQSIPEYILYDGFTKQGHNVTAYPFTKKLSFDIHQDIYHIHHFTRFGSQMMFFKRIFNYPTVFTPHQNYMMHLNTKSYYKGFSGSFRKKMLNMCYRKSDAIVVLSENEKKDLLRNGIKRDKINVIPNGIKTEFYEKPKTLKSRKRFNIPEDKIMVLWIGRLLKYKGIDYLLKAAKSLPKNVVIALKTHYPTLLPEYKKIAGDNVMFITDELTQKELVDLYYSCDIYAQPSLEETFGVVVTEAMLCGKPIVGSNVGGIPQQVAKGTGLLVEPKDVKGLKSSLTKLAKDESLRKEYGKNAKKHILKNFTQEVTCKRHIDLYKKLTK